MASNKDVNTSAKGSEHSDASTSTSTPTQDEKVKFDLANIRREIEEARTQALLRTCKQCNIRFLKEDGCNTVICTNCGSSICDYCGEDITKDRLNHFSPPWQSSSSSTTVAAHQTQTKCPQEDPSTNRKERQVEKAEQEARARMVAKYPELTAFIQKMDFSNHDQHQEQNSPITSQQPLSAEESSADNAIDGRSTPRETSISIQPIPIPIPIPNTGPRSRVVRADSPIPPSAFSDGGSSNSNGSSPDSSDDSPTISQRSAPDDDDDDDDDNHDHLDFDLGFFPG